MDFFQAILLGVVEGVTEFLPVSSTGHLILFSRWMGQESAFSNMFAIVIQLGAILSLPFIFGKRLIFPDPSKTDFKSVLLFWSKVLVAVAPALTLGFLFSDSIEYFLFQPLPIALALASGGLALILLDRPERAGGWSWNGLGYKQAFLIGLFQCLALLPGMSRSASTIIGALILGSERKTAAEFSFFLALPVLAAASGYSLLKYILKANKGEVPPLSLDQWFILGLGFLVSFMVSWVVSKWFLAWISRKDFRPFGWYRIALSFLVISMVLMNIL